MKIICLICGREFAFLPPHLTRAHGASVDDYRTEYQIPAGQPLCSSDYSAAHAAKMRRMQAAGDLTYDHLPAAVDAARHAGRGQRTGDDLQAQADRARAIPRQQLPPGAKRADGRDADRAREYQRRRREQQR
jgi:hypothetical protein